MVRSGLFGRVSARQVVAVVATQVGASSGRFWLGTLWQVLAVEARYGKFWRVEAGFGS